MQPTPRTPSFRLDGKRAVVTGAGRGLGLACAAALAEAGSAERLTLDVNDVGATRAAFALLDPFDILVNNAGTNRPKPFIDVTEDDYDAVIDLNLRAAFFVAQAAAGRMIAGSRRGSIIHMS